MTYMRRNVNLPNTTLNAKFFKNLKEFFCTYILDFFVKSRKYCQTLDLDTKLFRLHILTSQNSNYFLLTHYTLLSFNFYLTNHR